MPQQIKVNMNENLSIMIYVTNTKNNRLGSREYISLGIADFFQIITFLIISRQDHKVRPLIQT